MNSRCPYMRRINGLVPTDRRSSNTCACAYRTRAHHMRISNTRAHHRRWSYPVRWLRPVSETRAQLRARDAERPCAQSRQCGARSLSLDTQLFLCVIVTCAPQPTPSCGPSRTESSLQCTPTCTTRPVRKRPRMHRGLGGGAGGLPRVVGSPLASTRILGGRAAPFPPSLIF